MSRREVWQPPPNSPVLIVSGVAEDGAALRRILESEKWLVQEAAGCARALSILRQTPFPVLICQQELGRADWRDLLRISLLVPSPPQFIVSSRVADYQLWAEAEHVSDPGRATIMRAHRNSSSPIASNVTMAGPSTVRRT